MTSHEICDEWFCQFCFNEAKVEILKAANFCWLVRIVFHCHCCCPISIQTMHRPLRSPPHWYNKLCSLYSGAATRCPRPLQVVTWTATRAFSLDIIIHLSSIEHCKTQAVRCNNFPLSRQVFDLSNSKWGHGSPVSWASFVPNLSLLRPSILDLGSGTEQTDSK